MVYMGWTNYGSLVKSDLLFLLKKILLEHIYTHSFITYCLELFLHYNGRAEWVWL